MSSGQLTFGHSCIPSGATTCTHTPTHVRVAWFVHHVELAARGCVEPRLARRCMHGQLARGRATSRTIGAAAASVVPARKAWFRHCQGGRAHYTWRLAPGCASDGSTHACAMCRMISHSRFALYATCWRGDGSDAKPTATLVCCDNQLSTARERGVKAWSLCGNGPELARVAALTRDS